MASNAQVQRLEAQMQVEGVLGALLSAEVTHEVGDCLGDVGGLPELLGVGEAVVGLIGGGEARETALSREGGGGFRFQVSGFWIMDEG